MIAAGDGSPAAFARIRTGQYQIATVAEPLNEHGWQMADEINRALNDKPPSGYVTFPHLVTIANVNLDDGQNNTFNPPNGYEKHYLKIWGVS
jgi:ribose transport system substrate-binding protein